MQLKNGEASENTNNRPVPQELIEEVLVAAGWAPSAHNAQPWRFIVLAEPCS